MNDDQSQDGFTVVELLISLFIAAAFIGAGYQLYSTLIKDGGQAYQRSVASNVAYSYLRSAIGQPSGSCQPAEVTTDVEDGTGLPPGSTVKLSMTCPYHPGNMTSKLTATVTYGQPEQKVTHGMFVNG